MADGGIDIATHPEGMLAERAVRPVCGFIGLGDQGGPIAQRMIDAGFETHLWARRPEVLEPFARAAAIASPSVEELGAQVDLAGICVLHDDDVRAVCSRLLPAMRAGSIIAIHSTVRPQTVRELAGEAREFGLDLIDAPVSGGSPAASAGELTVMLGGEAAAIARAMPVFRCFGKLIVRVGDVGAGQQVKLINNSLFAANVGLALAAFEAGEVLEIDRGQLIELLQAGSGRSFGLEVASRMESPTAFRRGGDKLRTDVNLLTDLLGREAPAARLIRRSAMSFLDKASRTSSGDQT